MVQNKAEIQQLELDKAKKILIETIETQEAERARIGSDIHDDLGPTLSAMKLKISQLSRETPKAEKNVNQLNEMVEDTIKTVRGLSHSLYPSTLEKYGISSALNELAERIHSTEIKTICEVDQSIENCTFSEQINIYRIIQEFCNNSIKHSGCTEIKIYVKSREGHLEVMVSDNGKGFEANKIENGLGLKNMQMRANAINFLFQFDSRLNQGTSILLKQKANDE